MNPKDTAILWIDVDNEFLDARGKLHPAVSEVLEANRVIDNMNELNREARALGTQVVFIPIQFSDDYAEMGEDPQGIFRVVKEAGALKRDTWGTQVAECLDVQKDDLVLYDKTTTCAFATTNLQEELATRGIKHVAIGGLLTNICVESTMRTAYDKGYTVHALTDCSATLSLDTHNAAVAHDWPMFSSPINQSDLVRKLRGELAT